MKATITFVDGSISIINATAWGGDPLVPHTFQYDTGSRVSEFDDGTAMTYIIPLDRIKSISIWGGEGGY